MQRTSGPSRRRRVLRPRFRSLLGFGLGGALLLTLLTAVVLEAGPHLLAGGQESSASDPEALLLEARRALAHGRLQEVEALAQVRGGVDPAAAALLGHLAAMRGHHAEAERYLTPAATADPGGEAALELGLLQLQLGRREAGQQTLVRVLGAAGASRSHADWLRGALAARALGRFRDANTYFRSADAVHPRDPATNTAWGELFLEKYNRADAARSFRAALAVDPEWSPALLGLARTLIDENPDEARKALDRAVAIDPHNLQARLFRAELALDDSRRDEARKEIARALEINPASLEARALRAAVEYLDDRLSEFEAEVAGVLAINPTYGEVYRVAGDHAARNYRFDEAVELVSKAIELDPENTRAFADLGMHLLRTGDEPRAREVLERAFDRDPYDVITYNLLGLLDTLDTFETIRAGDLILRIHPEEVEVLREYALPLAQDALRELSARYGFQPRGPVLIEIFPRHDDFAVRTLGLPGMVGALGACFGRVVTLDSPRARPPGTFNWQATLWHELAHVITLQLSEQRVPRWLSEGISVYEEARARPEWGREGEISFASALEQDAVLKISDLNAGFTSGETIALAYYEASLLVEHIVEAYGETTLPQLVAAFSEGLDDEAAIRRALGIPIADLQTSFDASLRQRFATLRGALRAPASPPPTGGDGLAALRGVAEGHPDSFPVLVAYGRAAYAAGEWDESRRALERAAQLVPMATGPDSPRALLAEIALKQDDRERAVDEFARLLEHDHTDVEVARRLAELADAVGDMERLRLAYDRIVMLDPFDAGVHGSLGRMALRANEVDLAVREFRAALAAGPADQVSARCDLAEGYLAAGLREEAKREAIAALEIAPNYERAQELLLETIEGNP